MKIKLSSNFLIIPLLWMVVAIINVCLITLLFTRDASLAIFGSMSLVMFAGSVFNSINLFNVYKNFLIITDADIIVNNGLIYGKNQINLSEIRKVKYNKSSMVFYMTSGSKKRIPLLFVSKSDEIYLYKFLTSNSISIDLY